MKAIKINYYSNNTIYHYASDIVEVAITFNVFSYCMIFAENRTHHRPQFHVDALRVTPQLRVKNMLFLNKLCKNNIGWNHKISTSLLEVMVP